uniref:Cysteine rich repeat-containing domain protein n=1 Tax=Ascaris lumbricoides TaxID=6252 RepID=A0A0M3IBT9_ASCLU
MFELLQASVIREKRQLCGCQLFNSASSLCDCGLIRSSEQPLNKMPCVCAQQAIIAAHESSECACDNRVQQFNSNMQRCQPLCENSCRSQCLLTIQPSSCESVCESVCTPSCQPIIQQPIVHQQRNEYTSLSIPKRENTQCISQCNEKCVQNCTTLKLSTYCQPKCTQQCEDACDINRAQQQTLPITQQPTLNCAYECQHGCQQYSSCNMQQQKPQPKVIHIVMDSSVAQSAECMPQCVHLCNEQCSTSLPSEKCQLACETSCENSCTQFQPSLTPCQQIRGMHCDCQQGYAQCGYLPICCRR